MLLIQIEDLYSRIYEEAVDEITRENEALAQRAINAAISEAKMFLSRYDVAALFGTADTDPTVQDDFLKNIVIDIAVWRLVLLCNVGIDYDRTERCYEMTIRNLRDIQKGNANPDGWPYRDTTGQTAPQGSSVDASYNKKRGNDF